MCRWITELKTLITDLLAKDKPERWRTQADLCMEEVHRVFSSEWRSGGCRRRLFDLWIAGSDAWKFEEYFWSLGQWKDLWKNILCINNCNSWSFVLTICRMLIATNPQDRQTSRGFVCTAISWNGMENTCDNLFQENYKKNIYEINSLCCSILCVSCRDRVSDGWYLERAWVLSTFALCGW